MNEWIMQKPQTNIDPKAVVAIVGMGCIFPGAADPETFWKRIVDRFNASIPVPSNRWIIPPESVYRPDPTADKAYSLRLCPVTDFPFHPEEYDIDNRILEGLDPSHRMALYAARKAFASCCTNNLDPGRAGVVLAAIALPTETASWLTRVMFEQVFATKIFGKPIGYNQLSASEPRMHGARVTGLPAALIAEDLGLGGASFTLDAACASSLYAVKLACDELLSGSADLMLAGGVSRPDSLYTQVGFSQLRALSPSGRCSPFDGKADGLVVGEGAGVVVLKRLGDAIDAGDEIFGLIRGIGLSNDIRGNLLAPDSEGQVRSMKKAYAAAGWDIRDVDYIECHGAGTPVGDATELKSLMEMVGEQERASGIRVIGSVKSMIGHLLTAAGSAGLIKMLLAMKNREMPPTLNFEKPPENTPLQNSPFRVLGAMENWPERGPEIPRRAAVSAFGFGGINAHLLLEEWNRNEKFEDRPRVDSVALKTDTQEPVAIVGMDALFGSIFGLDAFRKAVFNGKPAVAGRPAERWKGADAVFADYFRGRSTDGCYFSSDDPDLAMAISDFHIPPNEIPDILPQQLLMLKTAGNALKDAGFSFREERPGTGAVIGIEFDFEATNYHIRWNLPNWIAKWRQEFGLSDEEAGEWEKRLENACGPPLTNTRTLGALGSIVASRVAREFRLGGPSFTVSDDAGSGTRALEIGVKLIRQNEADAMLVGAVDLSGDLRTSFLMNAFHGFSRNGRIRPFDKDGDGTLPGEGSAAIVLKNLEKAIKDGDRIYAVIRGTGFAAKGSDAPIRSTYARSCKRAFLDAGVPDSSITYLETHGIGNGKVDREEALAIGDCFRESGQSLAIGSLKPVIGHSGCVSGLAGVVKTALCLYHEILPPLPGFREPAAGIFENNTCHVPHFAQYWIRNRKDGPRRAAVSTITVDGGCAHVILEEPENRMDSEGAEIVEMERRRPLGYASQGLFVAQGGDRRELIDTLNSLSRFEQKYPEIPMEQLAAIWYSNQRVSNDFQLPSIAIVARDRESFRRHIADAIDAVKNGRQRKPNGRGGVAWSPEPLGKSGKIAFVFPGSGNHYVGMGRELGTIRPELLRRLDNKYSTLQSQMLPDYFVPRRTSWKSGWKQEAARKIADDPMAAIFGQVVFGGLQSDLLRSLGIEPGAVIGYSLGESAGYFAFGVWPDREEMRKRMLATDLFTTRLAGSCLSLRKAWNISAEQNFSWRVAVVNRASDIVKDVLKAYPLTRLLIVNTPNESVIGGDSGQIDAAIRALGCEAIFLDGVVTVHCDAAGPAAQDYRNLHHFQVTPPEGIRFYSCASAKAIELTSDSAADSILSQALHGFDFPKVIEQAYSDGFTIFIEPGPLSSCTRMIERILGKKPHLAVSADGRDTEGDLSLEKCLAILFAERVPLNLDPWFDGILLTDAQSIPVDRKKKGAIPMVIGGRFPEPESWAPEKKETPVRKAVSEPPTQPSSAPVKPIERKTPEKEEVSVVDEPGSVEALPDSDLLTGFSKSVDATARAHQVFLEFSEQMTRAYGETYALQVELLKQAVSEGGSFSEDIIETDVNSGSNEEKTGKLPALTREMCMEFAIGSLEKLFGPDFAPVDSYPVRVRLPDEPLMLVDRIILVEGEKGSMTSGRVVTEHDVPENAWYLDGGRAPVCISVEAGQADLFLCSYLGIDLIVKGKRAYRLLDATVRFHRGLPRPGDVIRYDIRIDKFIHQNETWMFFFHFDGFIDGERLITMRNGCAGFFTKDEVRDSGGIILTDEDLAPQNGVKDVSELVPMKRESYDERQLDALRRGDLCGCFGEVFSGIDFSRSLWLPDGRMRLIHRVLELDPCGGRYGIGKIRAEADIHPDDWFLTCHFVDDMVMPGTLMYECCAHTLRVFLLRMGWVSGNPDTCFEPVTDQDAVLKCRGPVTPETQQVIYEVEIREIGYSPEPFARADAFMYADGHRIVKFTNMSMKLTGASREEIEETWRDRNTGDSPGVLFDREKILAFATGKPSDAFGAPYRTFDRERTCARLPGPPYSFVHRVVQSEPEAFVLKPGGWAESEFDVDPEDWFFSADGSGSMPYCVLLEIGLQACGWLAAWMGSALRSEKDLRFRNLGGTATLFDEIGPNCGTLRMRSRLTKVSEAADMIIEYFDMEVYAGNLRVFEGNTYFGFFTLKSLENQVGIRDEDPGFAFAEELVSNDRERISLPKRAPLTPFDEKIDPASTLTMPSKALLMIDEIEYFDPTGGPEGLGYIRGVKTVDPDEWFFKAHFFQDPVWPGSLGVEAFLQLIKFAAIDRWGHLSETHRFKLLTQTPHEWIYRGQVIPTSRRVRVDAVIRSVSQTPFPTIVADGRLMVDNLHIYTMKNYGLILVDDERAKPR